MLTRTKRKQCDELEQIQHDIGHKKAKLEALQDVIKEKQAEISGVIAELKVAERRLAEHPITLQAEVKHRADETARLKIEAKKQCVQWADDMLGVWEPDDAELQAWLRDKAPRLLDSPIQFQKFNELIERWDDNPFGTDYIQGCEVAFVCGGASHTLSVENSERRGTKWETSLDIHSPLLTAALAIFARDEADRRWQDVQGLVDKTKDAPSVIAAFLIIFGDQMVMEFPIF
jgi:hypothetical protein